MKKRIIISLMFSALVLLGGSTGCVNLSKMMDEIMSRYTEDGGEYAEDADFGVEEE